MSAIPSIPRTKKIRRALHGVLLLDKPVGLSSNDALIRAKRLLNASKAGHTGTLDPFATGLLPLCFGEATKFSQDLLEADKTYQTIVHLGVKTETADTEGAIIAQSEVNVDVNQIESVLARFRGVIKQVPPMHSALKRDGKPLYEYARQGIVLEREARSVTIHRLELLSYQAPYLHLEVTCSKGTYIRVLGEDIGAALGCGAHLNALRRIAVGDLKLTQTLTLEQIEQCDESQRDGFLEPVDYLLSSFPEIVLPQEIAARFKNGQRLPLPKLNLSVPCASGRVRVYDDMGCLLGVAQIQEAYLLAPERLLALNPTP